MTRAVWQLAISNLAGRRGRSLLLILAVALSTALVVAAAAAMGTIGASLELAIGRVAGLSDLQITHRFNGRVEETLLERVRQWPEVAMAIGHFEAGITVQLERTGKSETFVAQGVEPGLDEKLRPLKIVRGRMIQAPGEIVIDGTARRNLEAELGDQLRIVRFGDPMTLTIVGVVDRPPLGVLQRRMAVITLGEAQDLGGYPSQLDQIDIKLRRGFEAAAVESSRVGELPEGAKFHTPASVRARILQGVRSARMTLLLLTMLVSLSAGFIILTSLTTSVTQRMRELAVLRCIGASRLQIALSQLLVGVLLSAGGALLGVPVGLGLAYILFLQHRQLLDGGFQPNPGGIALALVGAAVAGILGASYPAWRAARVRPMSALAAAARKPSGAGMVWCLLLGLAAVSVQPVALWLPLDTQTAFWLYATVGLPLTFVGYFLLAPPVLLVLTYIVAPLLSVALRLPGRLLANTVLATPFRHAFTGGALMMGLAILLAVWTGGRSVMGGWLDNLTMPDAFVHSYRALSPQQWKQLQEVPGVTNLCATTAFPAPVVGMQFGVKAYAPSSTLFVSVDAPAFFAMTDLEWDEGDAATALARMQEGRALLVSREYRVAHGIGKGATVTMQTAQGPVDFEVVGVVGATGLDVAVQFFGIQRAYAEASLSAVFGTRADAARYFGVDAINLVLMDLQPTADDDAVLEEISRRVPGTVVGSSRKIRQRIERTIGRFMQVAGTVAIASLVIACLGVGNLIIAEVSGRRFEYGVLRALGGQRGLLGRLVLAQTLVIAAVGCVVGTALGMQLALVGRVFHQRLAGLRYDFTMPWDVLAWGCMAVIVASLLAAMPTLANLVRQSPRQLLAPGRAG